MDAQRWDERYRAQDRLFSGGANGVLVAEVSALPPGRALDVGCGEGGDAVWLARRGWHVTGIDVSPTALLRAARAAGPDLAGRVEWREADVTRTAPPAGAYDLVSVHYFPLPRTPDHAALRGLLSAVAPGGCLLFVGHDLADLTPEVVREFDPGALYGPAEVAGLLGPGWTVQVDETRPRAAPAAAPAPAPGSPHHRHDTVLRARREP
ncbi:class I SAM-dependent methyltransferase [Streptomyces sp. J2-1]|uniref:class I SAM-dependent methyltransferase n=1 Tax=Streptomyces corallincola TaxID=2851888 RepID=UPI001C38A7C7|nr:class I SAM-dependent methyltransferase [Streptomyces corallincola]MBV2354108.1 class I SAM-dependent methyltransferase [Streptomyces corallincola]